MATPSRAAADPAQPCALVPGDVAYQNVLTPILGRYDTTQAVGPEALGPQYGGVWLSQRDQGIGFGVAPGALDLPAARTALLGAYAARGASGADLAQIDRMLFVYAVPFAYADLLALHSQLSPAVMALGPFASIGISCARGDAFRVHVSLFSTRTPEAVVAVQALIAPYGDRVHLELSDARPPTTGLPPRMPLESAFPHLSMAPPSRCVRGDGLKIRVRPASLRAVRVLRLQAGSTVRWVRGARLRDGLRVTLRAPSTAIRVELRLRSGSVAVRTGTYRRCPEPPTARPAR